MHFSRSLHQEQGPPQHRTRAPAPSLEMHLPDPPAPPRPPPTSTQGKYKRSALTSKGWVRLFDTTLSLERSRSKIRDRRRWVGGGGGAAATRRRVVGGGVS